MDSIDLHELTRQELYDKVWATPGIRLADELGVSDVAIAKRCRKLSVPRPPPGYWTKLAAGKEPRRPALPPAPEEIFAKALQRPVRRRLVLPGEPTDLDSVAAEFLKTVNSAKPDRDKRVRLRERSLPEAEISKAMAWRAAQSIHVLIHELESRGVPFRRSRSSYDSGYFEKYHDRLYLTIEEELVTNPGTSSRIRGAWGNMVESRVPGGELDFELKTDRYASSKAKRWIDNLKKSQTSILRNMVRFACDHYLELKKTREAEAIESEKRRIEHGIRWRKWQQEEAIRKQQEAERKHAESLKAVKQHREADLANAAQWWRSHQTVTDFIAERERRWREPQAGELTDEQSKWLLWARKTANALSPFESGYPEPPIDGAFDPDAVPFGGPYPTTSKFTQPWTNETATGGPWAR